MKTSELETRRACAQYLAGLGMMVFPAGVPGDDKMPLVRWRTDEPASCAYATVEAWWRTWPTANIGIDCRESSLLVIDIDSEDAADRWDRIWDEHADHPWDQGRYPVVETGRGWHIIGEQPDPLIKGGDHPLGAEIDIKGNGMVIGPGSIVNGHRRLVVAGDLADMPPWPDWLISMLRPRPQRRSFAYDRRQRRQSRWITPYQAHAKLAEWACEIERAPYGDQNNMINRAAHIMTRDFCPPLDPEEIRARLELAAEKGNHPEHRARPSVRSGMLSGLGTSAPK